MPQRLLLILSLETEMIFRNKNGMHFVGIGGVGVNALAKFAVVGSPGAFVDKRFVFYEWHSRLWLTLALARCAVEHRNMVSIFRSTSPRR